MGFDPLPVPPHVFRLDAQRLRYGQVERHEEGLRLVVYHAADLPPSSFQKGLLGGVVKDAAAFREFLSGFLAALPEEVSEGSLLLPDPWLRLVFAGIDELPRSDRTRQEVLRWKLKHLVPFRVDELRVSAREVAPLPHQDEAKRILIGFALENLLAQLEATFAELGVHLGWITNLSLPLVRALGGGAGENGLSVVALVEPEGYAVAFVRRGEPLLHRYKALTDEGPDDNVRRDLRLTRSFLEEHLPGAELDRLMLVVSETMQPLWQECLAEDLGVAVEPLRGAHLAVDMGERRPAPWPDLAPILAAATEEVG